MNENDTSVLNNLGEDYLQADGYSRRLLKPQAHVYMCYFIHVCEMGGIQEVTATHSEDNTLSECTLLPATTLEDESESSITNYRHYQNKHL